MKRKQIIGFSIISVILQLATAPFGGYFGGHPVKFLVAGIFYAAVTWLLLSRVSTIKGQRIVLAIMIIPILIPLAIDYTNGFVYGDNIADYINSTRLSWPSTLVQIISVFIGLWLYRASMRSRIIIGVVWAAFCVWVMLAGYQLWMNKIRFDHIFCSVDEPLPEFVFSDANNNTFVKQDLADKTVVLDFWFTGCGYCINEMPGFQELFEKYGRTGKVLFYSVNLPTRGDTLGQARNLIDKYHFTFPLLFVKDDVTRSFGIKGYPTYIIFSKDRIIYRGGKEGLQKAIKNCLK